MNVLSIVILLVGLLMLAIYAYPALTGRSFDSMESWRRFYSGTDPWAWSRSQALIGLGFCIYALTSFHTPVTALNVVFDSIGFLCVAIGSFMAIYLRRKLG